jgi:hypothetical protein
VKHVPRNTYCSRCGCTFDVLGEETDMATVEEMKNAKMQCPCCEAETLRHIHDEEGA